MTDVAFALERMRLLLWRVSEEHDEMEEHEVKGKLNFNVK